LLLLLLLFKRSQKPLVLLLHIRPTLTLGCKVHSFKRPAGRGSSVALDEAGAHNLCSCCREAGYHWEQTTVLLQSQSLLHTPCNPLPCLT
jgi:hypothetical protein